MKFAKRKSNLNLTCIVFPGLPGSELGGVSGGTYINRDIGVHKLLCVGYFILL